MEAEFELHGSSAAWRRLHRAWSISRIIGFEGLSYLIPKQISFREIGYGQGEGQIKTDGIEIGIYLNVQGHFRLIVHEITEDRLENAIALVNDICKWWTEIAREAFEVSRKE
jgi:hypothetical protein